MRKHMRRSTGGFYAGEKQQESSTWLHMLPLCKAQAACAVPPPPRVPKCQRVFGHSCAHGELPQRGSRDVKLMLTWHWQYSYLKSHSFGKRMHRLGWLALTIPCLPLHPLLQPIANPCAGRKEQVAAIWCLAMKPHGCISPACRHPRVFCL